MKAIFLKRLLTLGLGLTSQLGLAGKPPGPGSDAVAILRCDYGQFEKTLIRGGANTIEKYLQDQGYIDGGAEWTLEYGMGEVAGLTTVAGPSYPISDKLAAILASKFAFIPAEAKSAERETILEGTRHMIKATARVYVEFVLPDTDLETVTD